MLLRDSLIFLSRTSMPGPKVFKDLLPLQASQISFHALYLGVLTSTI